MHVLKQTQLAAKALPHVARMLSRQLAASNDTFTLRLQGEDLDLPVPRQALELFADILRAMGANQSVQVVAANSLLTTQQAADFFNVSRTHLLKLIAQGELAISKTGTHRRLALGPVMAYQKLRQSQQHKQLQAMADLDRELGIDDL